ILIECIQTKIEKCFFFGNSTPLFFYYVQGSLPFRDFFFNLYLFFLSQMEQLQEAFSIIEKEIIFRTLLLFKANTTFDNNLFQTFFSKTNVNNTYNYSINLQQQQNLMNLLEAFDNKIDKTTILKTWRNCNQIYMDTLDKLKEICATSNLNGLSNEIYNI
ncbi:hypothetical protein RFI_37049, partial [Reticulomyxa filosa]